MNDKNLFTEFTACDECLSPINGIPISGIKGFGTSVFLIGSRLYPVREVAFMSGNLQCTFSSSHVQRLNGFLSGIHSMHSSIKLTNSDGITTKFVPTIKNGLDYMTIVVVTPSYLDSKIISQACLAKSISPQLIHQKCGHFFQERNRFG